MSPTMANNVQNHLEFTGRQSLGRPRPYRVLQSAIPTIGRLVVGINLRTWVTIASLRNSLPNPEQPRAKEEVRQE